METIKFDKTLLMKEITIELNHDYFLDNVLCNPVEIPKVKIVLNDVGFNYACSVWVGDTWFHIYESYDNCYAIDDTLIELIYKEGE